jgi:putative phosphoribosyl transferase
MLFADRYDAGKKLAQELSVYREIPDTVILGLPRGGVITAAEVAQKLHLPLDILVTRKIGHPDNPEFALGAVNEEGEVIYNTSFVPHLDFYEEFLQQAVKNEQKEAVRRLKFYRGNRPKLNLENKIAILVDDGIATGATVSAAIASLKKKKARKIVVAAPVIAQDTLRKLFRQADEVVYLSAPAYFGAVGQFYQSFPQTTDEEVIQLLRGRE